MTICSGRSDGGGDLPCPWCRTGAWPSVEEQLLRNADATEMRNALNKLIELQREALQLIYLPEHSNEQTSNLLGTRYRH